MKAIENWVKDIVFYMIFVTMVAESSTGSSHEKYACLPGRL